MNRCTPYLLVALLLAASTSLISLPATAQIDEAKANVRLFPKSAERAELVILMTPEVAINGKPDRLSPAVRILDASDKLVLSGSLANQPLAVNYVRDNIGLIHQVWILSSEEIKQKMPTQDGGILSNIRSMFNTPAVSDDGKTPYKQLPAYKQ